jgi:uncharacterized protein
LTKLPPDDNPGAEGCRKRWDSREEHLKKLNLVTEDQGPGNKPASFDEEPVPVVNMCLFLTQTCNLKCVYCYEEEGKKSTAGNMDEKTAFRAVDWMIGQAGKMKKLHIGFFGGEPFLNFPLMKAVVEYSERKVAEVDKQVSFHTTSNGTVLDDEKIAFIKDHDIDIMVSFDGPREIQDAQRPFANGQGSYDSIMPKIKKLLAAVPKTHGHSVIVGDTDPRLVKKAMREIGFTEITIMPASPSLFADKAKPERDLRVLLQEIEQESQTWLNLVKNRDEKALKDLKAKSGLYPALTSLLLNSKRRHACGAGRGLVAVACSGDVYLCHRFVGREQYKLGSVFDQELDRAEYQKSPTTGSGKCTGCFARFYCAGGCKHENAGSCGSISSPPEDICRLKRRELELAAYITGNLDPQDRAFLVKEDIFPPKPCPLDF